ncbi:MAG: cytochrome b [Burkholderiales bacterium]
MPSTPSYTRTAVLLHAAMASLIAAGFGLGLYMTELDFSPLKLKLYSYHKWIGVSAFALWLSRLIWRTSNAAPPLPAAMPRWEKTAAGASHLLLYVLMAAVPLSGWLMSSAKGVPTVLFGLWRLPDLLARHEVLGEALVALHHNLNWALAAFVALHVAAALKHWMVDRDGVMSRMFHWKQD